MLYGTPSRCRASATACRSSGLDIGPISSIRTRAALRDDRRRVAASPRGEGRPRPARRLRGARAERDVADVGQVTRRHRPRDRLLSLHSCGREGPHAAAVERGEGGQADALAGRTQDSVWYAIVKSLGPSRLFHSQPYRRWKARGSASSPMFSLSHRTGRSPELTSRRNARGRRSGTSCRGRSAHRGRAWPRLDSDARSRCGPHRNERRGSPSGSPGSAASRCPRHRGRAGPESAVSMVVARGASEAQLGQEWSVRSGNVRLVIDRGSGETSAWADKTSPALTTRASNHVAMDPNNFFITREFPRIRGPQKKYSDRGLAIAADHFRGSIQRKQGW